jgi:hypothetical protein
MQNIPPSTHTAAAYATQSAALYGFKLSLWPVTSLAFLHQEPYINPNFITDFDVAK